MDSPGSASPGCAKPSATQNTIVLGAGTYVLSIRPSGDDDNSTGDLNVVSTVSDLTIMGAGAGRTTIDATGLHDRVLSIAAGANVSLSGLTITGGHAPDGAAAPGGGGATGDPGTSGGGIANSGTLSLTGVTVSANAAGDGGQGGSAGSGAGGAGGAGGFGGGIDNEATLTITDSTITGNHAGGGGTGGGGGGNLSDLDPAGLGGTGGAGGGIENNGTLTIGDSTIGANFAGGGGGGGSPTGTDDLQSGGAGGAGGTGGGIDDASGSMTITGTTLSANSAGTGGVGGSPEFGSVAQNDSFGSAGDGGCGGDGGGLAAESPSAAAISASTISGNSAGAGGSGGTGGVSAPGPSSSGGNGCAGGSGGGIASAITVITMTNSTVSGNFAGAGGSGGTGGAGITGGTGGTGGSGGDGGDGGGIDIADRDGSTMVSDTVAGNGVGAQGGPGPAGPAAGGATGTAGAPGTNGVGGGLLAAATLCILGQPCYTAVQNTIVASDNGGNCSGPVIDDGHNLSFPDATCPGINGDPKLGALQDNGGPTQTIALGGGSAAIDAVPATGAGCPATDQRGLPRPSGAACDIGAYEVTPPAVSMPTAGAITSGGARLSGSGTPNDGTASAQFQFGTSTAYGSTTPAQTIGGLQATPLSSSVTGLKAHTTYHFRLVVTSADGTATSGDVTFTTAKPPRPTLRKAKLKPSKFKPSRHATITYTDSLAATTTLIVSKCAGAKRCRRIGSFSHQDRAGANRVRLSGRLGKRALKPGRYRLALTARLDGITGNTVTVSFRID